MSAALARQRYLQRHIEPGLPPCPLTDKPWDKVLVIPAFQEEPALVQRLLKLPAAEGSTLVILVLNRPDQGSEADANHDVRHAVSTLPAGNSPGLQRLGARVDLYLHDLDILSGPIPGAQGVGLARKIGCDIAFKWMCEGAITGRWLWCTDADARLPADYFFRLENLPARASAATFPFWHAPGRDSACNVASALYELRLHHYVLGLEYAGSPYAFHTLGSCLALTFDGYAAVRGIPRRAGGEDFYLLNKLAKTGTVVKLTGDCIQLESRASHRVPFGTGPAVARISAAPVPEALALFYHPACFETLRALLACVPQLQWSGSAGLPELLAAREIEPTLAQACCTVLANMGLVAAVEHCCRQGKSADQFLRQFHQWFDGFRTLKFIHGIRNAGWPECSLEELESLHPGLWPTSSTNVEQLRQAIAGGWGWSREQLLPC